MITKREEIARSHFQLIAHRNAEKKSPMTLKAEVDVDDGGGGCSAEPVFWRLELLCAPPSLTKDGDNSIRREAVNTQYMYDGIT